MWNRIEYDEWTAIVPVIAFVLTFSVFVILVARALLMKKSEASQLAHLPLEDEPVVRRRKSDS